MNQLQFPHFVVLRDLQLPHLFSEITYEGTYALVYHRDPIDDTLTKIGTLFQVDEEYRLYQPDNRDDYLEAIHQKNSPPDDLAKLLENHDIPEDAVSHIIHHLSITITLMKAMRQYNENVVRHITLGTEAPRSIIGYIPSKVWDIVKHREGGGGIEEYDLLKIEKHYEELKRFWKETHVPCKSGEYRFEIPVGRDENRKSEEPDSGRRYVQIDIYPTNPAKNRHVFQITPTIQLGNDIYSVPVILEPLRFTNISITEQTENHHLIDGCSIEHQRGSYPNLIQLIKSQLHAFIYHTGAIQRVGDRDYAWLSVYIELCQALTALSDKLLKDGCYNALVTRENEYAIMASYLIKHFNVELIQKQ